MKFRLWTAFLVLSCLFTLPAFVLAQDGSGLPIEAGDVEVTSGDQAYQSYLAAPSNAGIYPGIVLVHSFDGLQPGYREMVEEFARQGFVVLAVGWQTFELEPSDDTVKTLVEDSLAFLSSRDDVDEERLGLTGFCAGGRYTMLLLPQIDTLKAGVAWYGFPARGEPAPVDLIDDLTAPMLIIHGAADEDIPVADIYEYATDLTNAGAYFELKVYSGQPHGFILSGGRLRRDEVAQDAFNQMVDFFTRKLT